MEVKTRRLMQKRKKHPVADKVLKAKASIRGWKTTDAEEIERRRLRASLELFNVKFLEPSQSFYGTFAVRSKESAMVYLVEIRSLFDMESEQRARCDEYRERVAHRVCAPEETP